jgi:ClpP class serine protease
MAIDYPMLAQRLFNTPLMIHEDKLEVVIAALADRFGIASLFRSDGSMAKLLVDETSPYAQPAAEQDRYRSYQLTDDGVAIIPVRGTLVQRLGSLQPYSGMTGYDGIRINFLQALDDDDVRAIVFDVDSPGGEVSGCFDLVDAIYDARGSKPIRAICTERAYSAAYAIVSAVDPGGVSVPRTGGTGSVGVIYTHVEMSKALQQGGIKVTIFKYGARKADGNEFEPLSQAAIDRLDAEVAEVGELFIETVARNRGLRTNDVRRTQASTYLGAHGVDIGFADAVQAPDAAFRALLKKLG